VEHLFQTFQYGEAGRQIYEFFWNDFADWYVEFAKNQIKNGRAYTTIETLSRVLDMSLRLLHPFTPFVTEELWGHLRRTLLDSPLAGLAKDWADVLIVARWPEPRPKEDWEMRALEDFEVLVVERERSYRNYLAENKISPSKLKGDPIIISGDEEKVTFIQEHNMASGTVSGFDVSQFEYHYGELSKKPNNSVLLDSSVVKTHLLLTEPVDQGEENSRLRKELAEAESQITRLEKLLSSDFANKAPALVVAKEREKLSAFQDMAKSLKTQLNG